MKGLKKDGVVSYILKSLGIQLAAVAMVFLIIAMVTVGFTLTTAWYSQLSVVGLILGGLLGGYYISSKTKEDGLIMGVAVSGLMYVFCIIISLIFSENNNIPDMMVKLFLITISGGIGGIIGVNRIYKRPKIKKRG